MTPTEAADATPRDGHASAAPARRRRAWPWLLLVLILALGALLAWNAIVYRPVATALADEHDISLSAYRRWLISPDAIVIDIRAVNGTASMAAMDRNLFKTAEALKDQRFGTVVLAFHGTPKWLMDAEAFQTIGRERAFQNPVYVMRTMQQNVKTLDGTPAFPMVSGGWLGVLGEELNQHKRFHEGWWLDDAMASAGATS